MFLESLEKLKEESIADGRAEGLEQGLEEGRQLGIEQGKQQGIAEGINKTHIETAMRMLAKGYAIEEIVELTGFSAVEVNKLKTNSTS